MASRLTTDLHWKLQPVYKRFEGEMSRASVPFILTCTYRSNAEQDQSYAQGRTVKGRVVTFARGGESPHNYCFENAPAALAFDICVMRGGRLIWNTSEPEWLKAVECGIIAGLSPGSKFSFADFAHFEHPAWRDIRKSKQ